MGRFEIIIKDLKEDATILHEKSNCIIGAIANKGRFTKNVKQGGLK